jgi:ABC-type microcin C transport system duplicated ATPase subunit YejF
MLQVERLVIRPGAAPITLQLAADERRTWAAPDPDAGRAIAVLLPAYAGRVLFEGRDIFKLQGSAQRALRQRLQYVGGDPRRALRPQDTVQTVLEEALRVQALTGRINERVPDAARALGLHPWLFARPLRDLSSGLRFRVMLARALSLHPQLLIVDQPERHVLGTGALQAAVTTACAAYHCALLWINENGQVH